MEVDSDPGGQRPVDVGQVGLEPDVLLAAHGVVDVVAEEDVVGGPHVHRVEKVGRRAARPVRRLHRNAMSCSSSLHDQELPLLAKGVLGLRAKLTS